MTKKSTPTGTDRRTPGRPTDPIQELRSIARRLHNLEKDAAVLATDLLGLETSMRDALAAPRIPVEAYTIDEVAEAIGLARSTVYGLVGTGELPPISRGKGYRRVLPADLTAYLHSLRHTASEVQS